MKNICQDVAQGNASFSLASGPIKVPAISLRPMMSTHKQSVCHAPLFLRENLNQEEKQRHHWSLSYSVSSSTRLVKTWPLSGRCMPTDRSRLDCIITRHYEATGLTLKDRPRPSPLMSLLQLAKDSYFLGDNPLALAAVLSPLAQPLLHNVFGPCN